MGNHVQVHALLAQRKQHLLLARVAANIAVGVARTRVLQGGTSVHMLQSGGYVNAGCSIVRKWIVVVSQGPGYVYRHASHSVNHALEAGEVYLREIVNLDAKVALDSRHSKARAAP